MTLIFFFFGYHFHCSLGAAPAETLLFTLSSANVALYPLHPDVKILTAPHVRDNF